MTIARLNFRMSYDDFKKNWVNLEICNLGPDVMEEVYQMTGAKLNQGQGWTCAEHDGAWISGVTAGGCRNKIGTEGTFVSFRIPLSYFLYYLLDTFAINPQFRVELTDADVNDNDDFCSKTFMVSICIELYLIKSNVSLQPLSLVYCKKIDVSFVAPG